MKKILAHLLMTPVYISIGIMFTIEVVTYYTIGKMFNWAANGIEKK